MLFRALLSIFYPQTCILCGAYCPSAEQESVSGMLKDRDFLCPACIAQLPRTEQAAVRENSTEMTLWGKCVSQAAAAKMLHLDRAAAFLFYEKEHPIQQLIHMMKYSDRPEIGYRLGREAASEWMQSDFFDEIDVIIPVPLHPNRQRIRGYNQSEYIAEGLSAVTGIPVDTTHLVRIKDTAKQAKISGERTSGEWTSGAELRRANVEGAFEVRQPEQLYGKHILLVDDLITTGETARACLKAMKRFRGAKFCVFALCKAR